LARSWEKHAFREGNWEKYEAGDFNIPQDVLKLGARPVDFHGDS
jgi:hypothetical protein